MLGLFRLDTIHLIRLDFIDAVWTIKSSRSSKPASHSSRASTTKYASFRFGSSTMARKMVDSE